MRHRLRTRFQRFLLLLSSRNLYSEIQRARLDAVEAWTDSVSTIITIGGLPESTQTIIALQALQIVLPKFEKSLADNMDVAGLFARLTLTLVNAIAANTLDSTDQQAANNRDERILAVFRVCLKAITDPETTPALRDVCYRTCCLIQSTSSSPVASTATQSDRSHAAVLNSSARQLLQQVQTSGERIISVLTEDAFSGRGSTRVSALLFLDALIALFQSGKAPASLLRALTKLNFVPVLLDGSLSGISGAFRDDHKDLPTTLSYFHTALALLLNLCRTTDGSQLRTEQREHSTASKDLPLAEPVLHAGNFQAGKQSPSDEGRAGTPREDANNVAEEFGKLIILTGFLEVSKHSVPSTLSKERVLTLLQDDEPAHSKGIRRNGFTSAMYRYNDIARGGCSFKRNCSLSKLPKRPTHAARYLPGPNDAFLPLITADQVPSPPSRRHP
ncbi:hypothetical protein L1887_62998 [Cichorium endivia]|nr:hypothetical protein L1887_62998 [Cichorium endivia]